MWTRVDLKNRAKAILHENYGLTMAVPLLVTVVLSILTGIGGLIPGLGSLAVAIFAANPVTVSVARFVLNNREGKGKVDDLLFSFQSNYGNILVVKLMQTIFVTLWSLLFIVPGIIKAYEYRMVDYILAENPEIDWKEALEQSKKMMYGQKLDAFVLDLSFFGWDILSGITCGLVGVLYAIPYQMTTNGELYIALSGGNSGNAYSAPNNDVNNAQQTEKIGLDDNNYNNN